VGPGNGKLLSRGPIITSFRMRRYRDGEGRTLGEVCPLTIRLGLWESIVSSPTGVRGRAPAENGFHAHLMSESRSHQEAIWNTLFSIFERWRGLPNVAGTEKLSSLSLLSKGLVNRLIDPTHRMFHKLRKLLDFKTFIIYAFTTKPII